MAVFRVEKTKDFTLMSNHHLRNIALSLKAKGLLSLMLSLPEDWDYTTKGLAYICKDGVDSIGSVLRELEQHGYLTRRRTRDENGRLGEMEYTIHELPVTSEKPEDKPFPPKREKPVQVKPGQGNPRQEKPAQGNPRQGKPVQEKPAQSSTKESSTKESNINISILPSVESIQITETEGDLCLAETASEKDYFCIPDTRRDEVPWTGLCSREELEENVKDQLDYPLLAEEYGEEESQEIVRLVADTLSLRCSELSISGSRYPIEAVKDRFRSLTYEHVSGVMDKLGALSEVRNPHAYLRTMLFNSVTCSALNMQGLFDAACTERRNL